MNVNLWLFKLLLFSHLYAKVFIFRWFNLSYSHCFLFLRQYIFTFLRYCFIVKWHIHIDSLPSGFHDRRCCIAVVQGTYGRGWNPRFTDKINSVKNSKTSEKTAWMLVTLFVKGREGAGGFIFFTFYFFFIISDSWFLALSSPILIIMNIFPMYLPYYISQYNCHIKVR